MRVTILASFALMACGAEPEDTGGDLPPEDTGWPEETGDQEFPIETGDTGPRDIVPAHTLTLAQWGRWDLSPFSGPFTSLVGQLTVQEYLDGVRPVDDTGMVDSADVVVLDCDLLFNLVGEPADTGCSGCEFTFDVTFYLVSGQPAGCHDPELPRHEEVRRLGMNQTESAIHYDYYRTGVWVRWYDALWKEDRVDFQWERSLSITVEEEDE